MARPPAVIIAIVLTAVAAGAAAVKWAYFTNPSGEHEEPIGLCLGGQYIYVVGFDRSPGYPQWRIEMYSKDDGKVVKVWTKPTEGGLDDCVVVGGKLYVVGAVGNTNPQWVILVFDLDLNLVKEVVEMEVRGVAASVASDGEYLYIAGPEFVSYDKSDWRWRVEKRRVGDLSLVAVYTANPTAMEDWAEGVGINPATGHLWVVGVGDTWRIEVLDRDLHRLMVLEPGISWTRGVVFDDGGNAYVYGVVSIYGYGGIVKYSKDGKELARATGFDAAGAAYIGDRLYVVADNRRLFVFDANLNKIYEVDIRPEISKHVDVGELEWWINNAVSDGRVIYVAGVATPKGASDLGWLVFALQPTAPGSIVATAPPPSPVAPPALPTTPTTTVAATEAVYVEVGEGSWLPAAAAVAAVIAGVVIAVKRRGRDMR
jgi:hypothetical protein